MEPTLYAWHFSRRLAPTLRENTPTDTPTDLRLRAKEGRAARRLECIACLKDAWTVAVYSQAARSPEVSEVLLELRGVFPHQQEFLRCPKRYVVVCSGTKSGKSVGGAIYAVTKLTEKPNVHGVWVAPTYSQAVGIGLEGVRELLPRDGGYVTPKLSGSAPSLTLANGSSIDFKSADQPDNLYGFPSHFAVLDEAGRQSEDAWNAIRSTLTATGGPVRLLSNPTPRVGWFFRLYSRGLDGSDPDVASFRWKT